MFGLLLGSQLPGSPLLPLLALAGGGLNAMGVEHWRQRCPRPSCLPAYTAPFVLLGWGLLAGCTAVSSAVGVQPHMWQVWLAGIGQIFLLDSPVAGALVVLGLLLCNRQAACWVMAGSACGLGFAWLQGEPTLSGLQGFNPALAALAFSHSRTRELGAIGLTLLLEPGLSNLPLPGLTAPFILACWLVKAAERVWRQNIYEGVPLRRRAQNS